MEVSHVELNRIHAGMESAERILQDKWYDEADIANVQLARIIVETKEPEESSALKETLNNLGEAYKKAKKTE